MKSTKLENLEKKFNMAQSLVEDLSSLVDDMPLDNFVPMNLDDEENLPAFNPNESMMDMRQLKMDFQIARQNIMKVVACGNRIMEEVSEIDLSDLKGSHIQALAQLQTALGANIKLILEFYKDLAAIEKLRQPPVQKNVPKDVPNIAGDVSQTNINVFGGSTAELLSIIQSQGQGKVLELPQG